MSRPRPYPPSARFIADKISDWCEQNGIVYEFVPPRSKGHPAVRIRVGRQTRKVFFASTTSDQRSWKNAIGTLRKSAMEIGWKQAA